jgi:hypothetical protein
VAEIKVIRDGNFSEQLYKPSKKMQEISNLITVKFWEKDFNPTYTQIDRSISIWENPV